MADNPKKNAEGYNDPTPYEAEKHIRAQIRGKQARLAGSYFEAMISGIRSEVVRRIYTVRVRKEERVERKSVTKNAVANAGGDASVRKQPVKKVKKPGRNDPCPCGKLRPNGLPMKYKDCCGKNS